MKMEDGRWKMEDGRWKMEDGRCKCKEGKINSSKLVPRSRLLGIHGIKYQC
jgi:hypothetical protein